MNGSAVQVCKIEKSYGVVKVLTDFSLSLEVGETLAILGPSGCGKTTLLRMLAGLDVPDDGEIYLAGQLASDRRVLLLPHQRHIGFVFQQPTLWPHMTVQQQLEFALPRLRTSEQRNWLHLLMEKTGISKLSQRYPDQLSGGQARRVAIARAFAARPTLLLLDEPLVNLDLTGKQKLLKNTRRPA